MIDLTDIVRIEEVDANVVRYEEVNKYLLAGYSPKQIAHQLGHSSTSITLNMYCQYEPSYKDIIELSQ